ncbi:MAG TPA: DUF4912 domain-containing protein [Pyrinomonadaceae bacterium]|nr:DUF4912 domain-containing protein [Pyrinomonadaceae bacterium]
MDQETEKSGEFGEIVFDIDEVSRASSSAHLRPTIGARLEASPRTEGAEDEPSPIFRELANPTLPDLPREARARLLMQSPTMLFFYWSVGANPYAPLHKALGNGTGGYHLALRLLDLTNQAEELHNVEGEGSWWFNVRPDTEYRAEIGFYSPSRPFVRILFSNTVKTPRKGPSPRRSSEARWIISGGKFADLLHTSGFEADAFEVAQAEVGSDLADHFARYVGVDSGQVADFDLAELQRVLALLAAGTPITDLKWKVSAELYSLLEAHLAKLSAAAIQEDFGVTETDAAQDESFAAIGGSLVNIRKPRYRPISSLELR